VLYDKKEQTEFPNKTEDKKNRVTSGSLFTKFLES
jgi:hypothetical protein